MKVEEQNRNDNPEHELTCAQQSSDWESDKHSLWVWLWKTTFTFHRAVWSSKQGAGKFYGTVYKLRAEIRHFNLSWSSLVKYEESEMMCFFWSVFLYLAESSMTFVLEFVTLNEFVVLICCCAWLPLSKVTRSDNEIAPLLLYPLTLAPRRFQKDVSNCSKTQCAHNVLFFIYFSLCFITNMKKMQKRHKDNILASYSMAYIENRTG